MSDSSVTGEAVEILQELGLKEYEAKCFVALSRLSQGTAKRISDISDVPRTRVYDATRVLQARGLVEVQHSNPQQFRAVDIDIALRTLKSEYEKQVADLRELLQNLDPVTTDEAGESDHEVWTVSETTAITSRLEQLIDEAGDEIRMLVRDEERLPESVVEALTAAGERGVSVWVGAATEELQQALGERTSHVETVITDADWLLEPQHEGEDVVVNCVVVVDSETILVSSARESGDPTPEYATVGNGSNNGLVVVLSRLLSREQSGLGPS
jgi:sugar-specific transcriptional regulator TrmB